MTAAALEVEDGRFLEARWLAERLEASGYVFIVILALFGSREDMQSYDFVCLTKPRGRCILALVETYSVDGGALYLWRRRR